MSDVGVVVNLLLHCVHLVLPLNNDLVVLRLDLFVKDGTFFLLSFWITSAYVLFLPVSCFFVSCFLFLFLFSPFLFQFLWFLFLISIIPVSFVLVSCFFFLFLFFFNL